MSRGELLALVSAQAGMIEVLTQRVAELERQLALNSSNSSRPPSSDVPWAKQPAKPRSSRSRSGRKPGKQPGSASFSRGLVDDPDETLQIRPVRCCLGRVVALVQYEPRVAAICPAAERLAALRCCRMRFHAEAG
jgi:hypothetical protein